MGALMVCCPTTGRRVSLGVELELGNVRSNPRLRRDLLLRVMRRRPSVVEGRCMDRDGGVQAIDANESGCTSSTAYAVVATRHVGAARSGGMGNAARRLT